MLRIVFRVNAGPTTGLGHLQRCLALASTLVAKGSAAHFVTQNDWPSQQRIKRHGFTVSEIPENSTRHMDLDLTLAYLRDGKCHVIVVDLRGVEREYLWALRKAGHVVVSIDDLGEITFPSHIVVNGNIYARTLPYRSETQDTLFLLGTDYVILHPDLLDVPVRVVSDAVGEVLVTVGGVDILNIIPKLLSLLDELPGTFKVTTIVGPYFERRDALEEIGRHSRRPVQIIYAPESVREAILQADLAVSGGGQTLYVLARLGCPSIALEVSPDQDQNIRALVEAGVVRSGRFDNHNDMSEIRGAILSLLTNRESREFMAMTGQHVVDGQGALRVARAIMERVGK